MYLFVSSHLIIFSVQKLINYLPATFKFDKTLVKKLFNQFKSVKIEASALFTHPQAQIRNQIILGTTKI